MRVRTYGVSKETAQKISESVFTDFYLKIKKHENLDETAKKMVGIMESHPDQCFMLILSSVVFAIGNFDRIEKLERWAEVTEDGKLDNENLKEFNPEFVV